MSEAAAITLDHISLTLGGHRIIESLSATFSAGCWHSLLGRSGCGKSSLLRMIAGLQACDSGRVETGRLDSGASAIAYMAQDDGLLPWLTTRQNVQLGPRLRGEPLEQCRERVDELMHEVGLAPWADALPAVLSGGMRQRAALARTLLEDRPIVLMDEPFSRLDSITRDELQTLACRLLRDRTVLLVTHDPMEALRLSHELHILQVGSPTRLLSECLNSLPPRALDDARLLEQLPAVWQRLQGAHASRLSPS